MIIQSKIKRNGGTKVNFPDEKLHFKPNQHGDHVDEVKLQHNIDRLLSIREGFCEYKGEAENTAAPVTPPASTPTQAPAGPSTDDETEKARLAEEAAAQAEKDRLAKEEANRKAAFEKSEAERKEAEKKAADEDRANVAAEYLEVAGKAPDKRWSANKIRAELANLKAK